MTGAKVFVAVLLMAGVAHAQTQPSARVLVGAARNEHRNMRYSEAIKLADLAWRLGESRPALLREMFEIAGSAAGSLPDEVAARLWFRRWLAVDPDAALETGTSPKLVKLLQEARLEGAKLAVHATQRRDTIEVTIESDPIEIAHAVRIGALRAELADARATLVDPATGELELLDRYGNVLAIIQVRTILEPVPPPLPPSPLAAVVRPPGPPWYAQWKTWGVATGGFAAIGSGALWLAFDTRSKIVKIQSESERHSFKEVEDLRKRFHTAQWTARIAFGGAAVAAAIGTVFYVRGRRESQLVVAPMSGGAQATWSLVF